MTVQVGWIGNKENPITNIIPVFKAAEARDLRSGSNDIRNTYGESLLALLYLTGNSFTSSYDFLSRSISLPDWQSSTLGKSTGSTLVMATHTAVTNLTTHPLRPAITYRENPEHHLITATTGFATKCRDLLGITPSLGDTEDITNWIVSRGLENLRETIECIQAIPCSMHMVFTLIEKATNQAQVYLMRSKNHPEWKKESYLHYQKTPDCVIYTSLSEEAVSLTSSNTFTSLTEESIVPIMLQLAT